MKRINLHDFYSISNIWNSDMIGKTILLLLTIWNGCDSSTVKYDGYKVYRLHPYSEKQKELLLNLSRSEKLDFWNGVNNGGLPIDVMVKPEDQKSFTNDMWMNDMEPIVQIEDVQSIINKEENSQSLKSNQMSWTHYQPLEIIHEWIKSLEDTYPGVAKAVVGGKSYEGKPIMGVKISFEPGKRIFFLECGIHAREWISPATCTWIINYILTTTDPSIKKILHSFEWHIFPIVNPDGYKYSYTKDRMWRKTRTPYSHCYGADPNRNFNIYWNRQGSNNRFCSESFAGPRPFSEYETATFSKYIIEVAPRMDVYISMHSYSQLLLLPYGFTSKPLDNYYNMMKIGRKCIEALAKRYGTRYNVGNIAEILYEVSGSSIDWVKRTFRTPVVLAYELRDAGANGFLLPPNQIIPNSQEVMDSLLVLLQESEKFGYVNLIK